MIKSIVVKSQRYFRLVGRLSFVLFVLIFTFSVVRSINQMLSTGDRLVEAQNELEKAKNIQEKLLHDLSVVTSVEYKEKQARDKLGLAKEGEIVIVLPDEVTLKKLSPRNNDYQEISLPDPVWRRWVEVFFNF